MNLVKGTQYQVASSHCFHANRIGRFEFLGGPDRDVIVLSEPLDSRHLFAVGLYDIISFDPKKDNVIENFDIRAPKRCVVVIGPSIAGERLK